MGCRSMTRTFVRQRDLGSDEDVGVPAEALRWCEMVVRGNLGVSPGIMRAIVLPSRNRVAVASAMVQTAHRRHVNGR